MFGQNSFIVLLFLLFLLNGIIMIYYHNYDSPQNNLFRNKRSSMKRGSDSMVFFDDVVSITLVESRGGT